MQTPLQVVVVTDEMEPKGADYVDALRLVFEGALPGTPVTYLGDAVDLGIHVLVPSSRVLSSLEIGKIFGGAAHSIVVVLQGQNSRPFVAQNLLTIKSDNRAEYLIEETIPGDVANGEIQNDTTSPDGVEPALRPSVIALKAMQLARQALQWKGDANGPLKFFLSHAKLDGIPSALSLLRLLKSMEFGQFYDAESILPGDRWRDVLEENASNSVMIVLRTNEYENRYWCRREFEWAETSRLPMMVVDLRTRQFFGPSRLPFENAPTARLYDGNLLRVVLHAQANHLRHLRSEWMLGAHGLAEPWVLLPRKPSEIALHSAATELSAMKRSSSGVGLIVYPGPKGTPAYSAASQQFLSSYGIGALTNLDDVV